MKLFLAHDEFADSADGDTLKVVVPKSISAPIELIRFLASALRFPSYFGENWNALFDCLCDFGWAPEKRIVIVHEDVPPLPADHLKVYLNILADAVYTWRSETRHELLVVFPSDSTVVKDQAEEA